MVEWWRSVIDVKTTSANLTTFMKYPQQYDIDRFYSVANNEKNCIILAAKFCNK